MTRFNDAISSTLLAPYAEQRNDCVSMIERAHDITRPAAWRVELPEDEIVEAQIAEHGSVEEAYSVWLREHFQLVEHAPRRPGMVVIVQPPPPIRVTLGLVDDAHSVRWRAGNRMLTLSAETRALSTWERR